MNTLNLRESRDFGDVISATFSYIRIHFKTLAKGLILFSLPLIILSGILVGKGFGQIFAMSEISPEAEPDLAALTAFGFSFFLGLFLLIITFTLIISIVFQHMKLVDEGEENITLNMLIEDFLRNFLGVIGITIITSFVSIIGAFFFILPGIFLAIKLSLAPAIYVIEEEDFGEALSRSWDVTGDNWWFTFGVSFVISLIMNIITNIVVVPMYLIMGLVVFSSGDPSPDSFGNMFSIMYGLMMIFISIFYCIPVISQAFVYFTLNERKSGDSLSERIDAIKRD